MTRRLRCYVARDQRFAAGPFGSAVGATKHAVSLRHFGHDGVANLDVANAAWRCAPAGWIGFDGAGLNAITDDLQRQEVLFLLVQNRAQQVDIVFVKLAIARGRALWFDEALTLEKTNL